MSSSSASAADRLAALGAAATGPEREAAILAALEDEAPLVRDFAIRLASRHVEPQVLGALVADGENAARRNGALAALERQGPYAVPYLLELLRSPDAELVMFALQVLARIGEPTSTAGIRPLLRHPDPNVAQAAIETLGRLRTADAVPALLELLDGELWLQLAAVTALGEIGDPAAVGPLLALVPGSVLAEPAVRALQRIAAPESLEPFLRLLSEIADPGLRQAVLEAVAVVLDFHPDPAPVAMSFARELERAGTLAGLTAYLSEILRRAEAEAECARELGSPAPTDEPALSLDAAAQAAAAVVLTARVGGLYPLVLRRVGDPDAPWAEPLWRRHAALAREELASLLSHPDPAVRRGILLAGGFDPADLPALLLRLNDPEPAVRAAACRALGATGDGRAAKVLVDRIRHGTPEEREEAAGALGRLPPDALDPLRPCLAADAREPVRVAALEAVRLAGAAAFEREVLDAVRAPSDAVRLAALRAVATLSGTRAEVALLRALGDRDERIQAEALELLAARGGDRIGATLIALLSAEDSLRFRVIRALGRLRTREAAPKLEALYPEVPLHEQVEIVRAVAAIGAPGAVGFLRGALGSPAAEVRRVAAIGLADLATPDELGTLIGLAQDPDWSLRNEAARGLGRLALPEGRTALLTLVRDVEAVVARTARIALSKLGDGSGTAAA